MTTTITKKIIPISDSKKKEFSGNLKKLIPDISDEIAHYFSEALTRCFEAEIEVTNVQNFVELCVATASKNRPINSDALYEKSGISIALNMISLDEQEKEISALIQKDAAAYEGLEKIWEFEKSALENTEGLGDELIAKMFASDLQNALEKIPAYKNETASARNEKLTKYINSKIDSSVLKLEEEVSKILRSRFPDYKDLYLAATPSLASGKSADQLQNEAEILKKSYLEKNEYLPAHQGEEYNAEYQTFQDAEKSIEQDAPLDINIRRPYDAPSDDVLLWAVIRNRTQAVSFNSYMKFIESYDWTPESADRPLFQGVDAFTRLREITEAFLLTKAGILPFDYADGSDSMIEKAIRNRDANQMFTTEDTSNDAARKLYSEIHLLDAQRSAASAFDSLSSMKESLKRLGYVSPSQINQVKAAFLNALQKENYFNPYLSAVLQQFQLCGNEWKYDCHAPSFHLPDVERARRPLFMELIWSYWQEQGMLTQTMKSVALRFQNKTRGKLDRLAHLEIDPLRPVNNLIWGYIQGESRMLTVTRRNYEYQHQYGLTLSGNAVGDGRAADVREQFLEAFHTLLHLCSEFYRQDDDRMVTSDAFPVLNALKEVHLYLSKGAHNQFGDLAWTARTEMLMEQWILSHNALREFISGRIMTAYPERWQRQVDGMMSIQGWGDISCIHFNNLAAFGEQILLSIRYIPWVNIHDQTRAKLWAQFWRQEIQGYIHAYRAATGVDLSGNYAVPVVNATQPDPLIRRRRAKTPALGRF